ncbi:MAG: ethanolamine utilization protein EutN [Armatimonadetes bacterium]|nr:ethanolamine utilization protein EutN [Armatimonadota bacterium]
MIYAEVLGSLWSTVQVTGFEGRSIKAVVAVDPADETRHGSTVLAVDLVGARTGDRVLVVYEGSSSRLAMEDPSTPCEAVIVGIVDGLDLAGGPADSRLPTPDSRER